MKGTRHERQAPDLKGVGRKKKDHVATDVVLKRRSDESD
jgi:hypothetical protein